MVEIVVRNPAGYAQAGGEPKPCQVTRTRGSPGCGVSVTAVRGDAICRSNPVVTLRGREWKISSRSMRQHSPLGGRGARRCVSLVVTRLSFRRPGVRLIIREPSPSVEGKTPKPRAGNLEWEAGCHTGPGTFLLYFYFLMTSLTERPDEFNQRVSAILFSPPPQPPYNNDV